MLLITTSRSAIYVWNTNKGSSTSALNNKLVLALNNQQWDSSLHEYVLYYEM